jgi:hypothetical protein
MLQRNLLYTGITRGKRLVVLVGQMKAGRNCRAQCIRTTAMVETRRMVSVGFVWPSVEPCFRNAVEDESFGAVADDDLRAHKVRQIEFRIALAERRTKPA